MDGILIIRKEKGYTSHDVVAKLRGILRMKKIGHTGTLDPEAEGVLPVSLGKATRLCEMLTEKEKTYEALLHLGIETDTQDMTGTVLRRAEVQVTQAEVLGVMHSFLGDQMQIPPMYSALKVNGRKLYELAREGKVIDREARAVHFEAIDLISMELPLVRFSVVCSKGTYIRTLCHDIGQALGCGGCMEELVRTRSGRFSIENSVTLAQVQEAADQDRVSEMVIGIEEILADYPRVLCTKEGDRLLLNGNPLHEKLLKSSFREGPVRMCTSDGGFTGIYQWNAGRKTYVPVKMFL